MGCYLAKPDDRVYITEGKGKNFRYSTASCQGWRREQEDAEDCLPDFDDDASLFILCDGHGGFEVAKYTVEHFPEFLKNHKLYQDGDYEKALEAAFIEFDQYLRTPEVLDEIERIAMDDNNPVPQNPENSENGNAHTEKTNGTEETGPSNSAHEAGGSSSFKDEPSTSAGPSTSNGPTSVVEDVDCETLRKEAHIPIEELITKYSGPTHIKGKVQSLRHAALKISGSPVIRSSQRDEEDDDDDDDDENEVAPRKPLFESKPGGSSSGGDSNEKPGPSQPSDDLNRPSSSNTELEIIKTVMEKYFKGEDADGDDDDDSDFDSSASDGDDDDDDENEMSEDEDDEDEENEDIEQDNSDDDDDGDDEREDEASSTKPSKNKRLRKKHQRQADENSSSSDNEDSSDIDEAGIDEDEEEGDEDGVGVDPQWLSRNFLEKMQAKKMRDHRPGWDSGCTVVVTLVKGDKIYVASAGDSRCIVVRKDGRHEAMSFDHKPEDSIELARIKKAGGYVAEGRVNGGLNLSRAFGDFSYKDEELDPKEQKITPSPDVKTLQFDTVDIDFVFLACDGIWNSMTNAKVAKFIHSCWHNRKLHLVETCMELFKSCIAPNTEGDGTGCDNMTCILVKYYDNIEAMNDSQISEPQDLKKPIKSVDESNEIDQPDEQKSNSQMSVETNGDTPVLKSIKRSAELDEDIDTRRMCKRRCLRLLEE